MRLLFTLPCLLALSSTVIGAAAPVPVARTSAKSSTARSAKATASADVAAVNAPKSDAQLAKEREGWLAACQALHALYGRELDVAASALERIEKNPAFSALPSHRNRQQAAIPAANAMQRPALPEASDYAVPLTSRPAPMEVEQVMRQGESIAFRTRTSSTETQGLVSRIRRVPGVASGGHLGMDGMSSALLTPHLRTVPGYSRAPRAYAVADVHELRAAMTRGKADLDGEYEHVRDCWALLSAQSDELQRQYGKLRDALVARDE